jgi:hypothetical protein
MLTILPVLACGGPLHQGKIETTVNLSQGYRRGDTIFFLADVHRYRPGRTLWFIMPFSTGPKTVEHRTALYSLDAAARSVRLEAVLADQAEPTCMVSYAKWKLEGGVLYFSYNPSNRLDAGGHTGRVLFRRDMTSGRVENAPDGAKLEAELFKDYRSPYRDNPGVVEISGYKQLLPDGWPPAAVD